MVNSSGYYTENAHIINLNREVVDFKQCYCLKNPPIGRVQKDSVEKCRPTTSTGEYMKCQVSRLLIAGYFCLSLLTSAFLTGLLSETKIDNNQCLILRAITCITCAGSRPAFFPPQFSLPPYSSDVELHGNRHICSIWCQ